MTEAELRKLREQGVNPAAAAVPLAAPTVSLGANLPRTPIAAPVAGPVTAPVTQPAAAAPAVQSNYAQFPVPGQAANDARAGADANLINSQAAFTDEQTRLSGLKPYTTTTGKKGEVRTGYTGVVPSRADFYGQRGGPNDPFTNGFFGGRQQQRQAPAIATLPRTPAAPVGGTVAVIDKDTGPNGNTRANTLRTAVAGTQRVAPYMAPGTEARTDYGAVAPGTRRPYIGDGSGRNLAADYVAGGRFSSAVPGTDQSLDQQWVAGLPRKRRQVAIR